MRIPDIRQTSLGANSIDSSSRALRFASSAALALLLVALWTVTHRYLGFDGDAKLYAFQALARTHPSLANDVFLQNVSQDRFTIFSPFYSWCIGLLGLQRAEMVLTIAFKVWFLSAAWSLARAFSSRYVAFLATASVIVLIGRYGAFNVFQYSEDWLTARSMGEALAITALALHFHGFRLVALLVAALSLFVHPLMAAPAILLLFCLWTTNRISVLAAAAGTLLVLAMVIVVHRMPFAANGFPVVDASWLEVVRERSQFLFLQNWPLNDWKVNVKPFITLTLAALCLNVRMGKLCTSAMLVGATGLALALIASYGEPLAVLLQGQAWRWVWITTFCAILLMIPTCLELWRNDRCGPLCALLLVCGWTFTMIDGVLCASTALLLWLLRHRIGQDTARYLRFAAIALGVLMVGWTIANCWTITVTRNVVSGRESAAISTIRSFASLEILTLSVLAVLAHWIERNRSAAGLGAISLLLLAASAATAPSALEVAKQSSTVTGAEEFSDWRSVIPPASNVFVVPSPVSASFAWFILERPNYLSADQSSGVVFSRQNAIEIRRRADVVLPLWDTNWRLKSRRDVHGSAPTSQISSYRPLTKEALAAVCRDPQLNFVVAKETVESHHMLHTHPGTWKDWNLYDCLSVNAAVPPA